MPARWASRRCNSAHTHPVAGTVFDDPNLVSPAGLVPVLSLAHQCRLHGLAGEHLTVGSDEGSDARRKVTSLVAGMVAGADSIDDMALLRHRGMGQSFRLPVCALDVGVVPAGFSPSDTCVAWTPWLPGC
jgi:hypothetical protein